MADSNQWTRRGIVKAAGASAVTVLAGSAGRSLADETKPAKKGKSPGKIKQSVCRWCYKSVPLEKLANEAKRIGYQSIELLNPEEYQVIKPLGLSFAMLTGVCQIPDCYNRTKNHDKLNKGMKELIEFAAVEGLPNVICFSGNRRGHGRRRGPGELRRGPEASDGVRRGEEGHRLHGAAEQQGEPRRLHVRQHDVGRRAVQAGRLASGSSCSTTSTTCRSWKAT